VWNTLILLLPQTVLAALACVFIVGGTFPVPPRRWGQLSLVALALAGGALVYSGQHVIEAGGQLAVRGSPIVPGMQWAILVLGALFVLIALGEPGERRYGGEFYGLLLILISGVLLVTVANDLILLFLSLELISVPTYVLLYLGRNDHASQEAATKYFLLSILSAAMLLYGFAFLYGLTGNTRLDAIHQVLRETYDATHPGLPGSEGSALGIIALVMVFAGLSFKIAAVPFHFYAPDVYEGTSTFNAGLLAVAPKIAGFVGMISIVSTCLVGFETSGQQLCLILAAITMTGGNCLALLQSNIRRMLAYSSIAHAGYMLIGIAVGFWEAWNPQLSLGAAAPSGAMLGLPGGLRACLLYLLAYSLTTAGLFGALVYLGRPGKQIDHVDELTGLGKTHPMVAVMIALFLFSLAGIPPLPGFWAKLGVFAGALSVHQESAQGLFAAHPAFLTLAVIGAVNAAIGAVYYLRLVAIMFLNEPLSTARPEGRLPALAGTVCAAILVTLFGLAPRPVFDYLQRVDETPAPPAAMHSAPVAPEARRET
jgi:NADH-quinone oxidoreductase subunit N